MTRDEILLNSIWTEAKLVVHSPFFNQQVRVDLVTSDYVLKHVTSIISETLVQTLNDFLTLSEQYQPLMKKLIYQHCLSCCNDISYGVDINEGETETEANLREFGVTDETSAFEKANLDHVYIKEDSFRKNRFVKIVFYPEWEREHGCELILKNGELLDFSGENGMYLGQFDE